MSISNRLEEVRVSLGLKKREFASLLGIHANSYTNYISGSREIPLEILRKVSNAYSISYEWLINGTGRMRKYSVVSEAEQEYGNEDYNFRITNLIPYPNELIKLNNWQKLNFRNESRDGQFLLSIGNTSEYLAAPYISVNDLLLCSSEAAISNGNLVAAKWGRKKSGIRLCNYSGDDRQSVVLTSLNQSSPPVILDVNEVTLFKVMMIIKA